MPKKFLLLLCLFFFARGSASSPEKIVRDLFYYDDETLIEHDAAYAKERCRLDVFVPAGNDTRRPVVLFFHGGGLTGGKKYFPEELKKSGAIVVAANYRFSGDRAKCPDYLFDAAAAANWVFKHIGEYGGDPDAVVVTGHSAGGYLAAMIGLDARYLAKFGESNLRFLIVAPVSGQMTTHFQIQNERLGTQRQIAEHLVVDEYAPLYHAGKNSPHVLLLTGGENLDWPGRPQENRLLAAMLQNVWKDARAECFCIEGFNHATCVEPALSILVERYLWQKFAAKRRASLMPSPYTVGGGEIIHLQGKRGGSTDVPATAVIKRGNGKFIVEVLCSEPDFADVQYTGNCWSSNCVQLYLGDGKDAAGQWGVDSSGRTGYCDFGFGETHFTASAERTSDGWRARFEIAEDSLPKGKLFGNITRTRNTQNAKEFSCWSPIFGTFHLEKESFVELK
ncbi:MAG: alpha/beta fold hydrolase [Victivallaceae bacterium]|nr:alpha/beta fold hydrolase [Victivallaceae bacterium]